MTQKQVVVIDVPPRQNSDTMYDAAGRICGAAVYRADGQLDRQATREAGGRYWLTTSGCLIDLAIRPQVAFGDVVEYRFRLPSA